MHGSVVRVPDWHSESLTPSWTPRHFSLQEVKCIVHYQTMFPSCCFHSIFQLSSPSNCFSSFTSLLQDYLQLCQCLARLWAYVRFRCLPGLFHFKISRTTFSCFLLWCTTWITSLRTSNKLVSLSQLSFLLPHFLTPFLYLISEWCEGFWKLTRGRWEVTEGCN